MWLSRLSPLAAFVSWLNGRLATSAATEPGLAPRDGAGEEDIVARMLAEGREAWLLRPQIAGDFSEEDWQRVWDRFAARMSRVPSGEVLLQPWLSDSLDEATAGPIAGRRVTVEAFYLDRHAVTNAAFRSFVESGGYREQSLWHASVWERVSEFVDRTGSAGPRDWIRGDFPLDLADHPVTGISWFEADAYARWVGKRLPSDAEWVKAATWPVVIDGGEPLQRKYPWGDAMEPHRGNVWSAGQRRTAAVSEFAEGTSVGGSQQLIGNVWEWTSSNVSPSSLHPRARFKQPLKSLRGGAFDTYFDHQATCQFQSGDCPLARRHNIGFRCAISACDVLDSLPTDEAESPEESLV